MILVTGGAGFIGSCFIRDFLKKESILEIINLDKLTYAGNLSSLESIHENANYKFIHGSIGDYDKVLSLLKKYKVSTIVNFAAESHVDRSIHGPKDFIDSNIVDTFNLLQASLEYFNDLEINLKKEFRFVHVSTDEVYGSLGHDEKPFKETNQYKPNSPYAASKAASDHLVRSWHHTFDLPVITTNCSNNYGPYQFPEKLIPLCIQKALKNEQIPIYGDGKQIRDWLYVEDHCAAIRHVIRKGKLGETYNIGGNNEIANIDIVTKICKILDKKIPKKDNTSYLEQITFIKDRPGHDRRYAIDASKVKDYIGWQPKETFETGIEKTIDWYLSNSKWIDMVVDGSYAEWLDKNYKS
jgi:dTDP-glucose 4,6-dehydratase